MKKSIYISILAFACTTNITFGQVGIGTPSPDPSTVLDVVASDKGFLAPQIALASLADASTINAPEEGMLVYNTTDNALLDPGYYFWDGTTWQPTGLGSRTNIVSDGVIPAILGYTPDGIHPGTGSTTTVDGVLFTNRGCTRWTASGGNNHWYCAYTSGANGATTAGGVNWGTAFNVGKQLKGYLVTITSNAELAFITTNILNSTNGGYGNFSNNIWIGNSKAINMSFAPANQPAPGIPIEFLWITGEESKYNWSNTTTVQQNFANNTGIQNEPNNLGNNEGCTHIWPNHSSFPAALRRLWNDAPCTVTSFWPGNLTAEQRAMNQLVIEFNQ